MRNLVWRLATAAVLVCFFLSVGAADEGMWPLYALDKLDFEVLQERGLELGPKDIFNEKDGGIAAAVCQVGGGTGSFVSPEGLIVTNHHVAFGAIQKQSDLDQNYLRDGFLAETLAEEIPAIGYNVYVTLSFEEVTGEINSVLTDEMGDLERYEAIDGKEKELVADAEAKGDYRCRVVSAHGGWQYYLVTSFRLQDVRIVYVPPQAIGEFGGDIDNWMWPRHTGDFSFLRAYVAPDGSSAEFSEDNVPFQPQAYLPISSGPLDAGDYAMIIGYPGRTMRYRSSYSINEYVNHDYPSTLNRLREILDILEADAAADEMTNIKLAGMIKGINNYYKNTQGMLESLRRADLLKKKRQQEHALTEFIAADPDLQAEYGDVLPKLEKLYDGLDEYRELDEVLGGQKWLCRYLSMAGQLYKWSIEKTKPDVEREPAYMDRNLDRMRRRLEEAQFVLVPATDQRLLEWSLAYALRLPEGQRIEAYNTHFATMETTDTAAAIHAFCSDLYAGTNIGDVAERMKMFEMSTEKLLALDDSFINLAAALYDLHEERSDRSKAFAGATSQLRPKLIEVYALWKGESFYPDANGTIRLTYGEVKGYSPEDGVFCTPFTTLSGTVAKETGEEPFANPPELLATYEAGEFGKYLDSELGDVPVNFLTTNDGTGGNSGSPVINGSGEIIGLDFDTNWEGIIGDYYYDPEVKRSICVDSRYMLWVMDKVYGATSVLEELTIH